MFFRWNNTFIGLPLICFKITSFEFFGYFATKSLGGCRVSTSNVTSAASKRCTGSTQDSQVSVALRSGQKLVASSYLHRIHDKSNEVIGAPFYLYRPHACYLSQTEDRSIYTGDFVFHSMYGHSFLLLCCGNLGMICT